MLGEGIGGLRAVQAVRLDLCVSLITLLRTEPDTPNAVSHIRR